jgi:hypothetical protein
MNAFEARSPVSALIAAIPAAQCCWRGSTQRAGRSARCYARGPDVRVLDHVCSGFPSELLVRRLQSCPQLPFQAVFLSGACPLNGGSSQDWLSYSPAQ